MSIAKDIMKFALSVLPDLLTELGDDAEEKAFEELQKRWQSHRKDRETAVPGTNIEDRSDQVEANRSEVDARLAERAAEEGDAPKDDETKPTGRRKRSRRGGMTDG